ncbi:MAG: hypothetical protein GY862_15355 [Gammaproteobacteria bacterium]|nr:hypothetical protein [Gammaproteobacteria bacterium]
MSDDIARTGKELLNIPMGELISSVATAIADAQFQLDKSSMTIAEFMSGQRLNRDLDSGQLLDADGNPSDEPTVIDSRVFFGCQTVDGEKIPQKLSMMELGFVPNFYQFVDTIIEMRVAMKISKTADNHTVVTTTPVDAAYASSYSYNLEAASVVKTKLVPVPPPVLLEQRISALLE